MQMISDKQPQREDFNVNETVNFEELRVSQIKKEYIYTYK